MICVGVNHSVNRHQLMYKRKRHPEVEASQMPYSYQPAELSRHRFSIAGAKIDDFL